MSDLHEIPSIPKCVVISIIQHIITVPAIIGHHLRAIRYAIGQISDALLTHGSYLPQ